MCVCMFHQKKLWGGGEGFTNRGRSFLKYQSKPKCDFNNNPVLAIFLKYFVHMIFPFPIGNFLQWLTGRVRVNMNHEERRYRTRYQISDIRYQISDIRYQISDSKYQISNIKYHRRYLGKIRVTKCLRVHDLTFGSRISVWWIESESDLSFSQLMVCHPHPSYFDRSLCSLHPQKIHPELIWTLHFLPGCSPLLINYISFKSEKLPNLSIGTMWGGYLSHFPIVTNPWWHFHPW